MTERTIIPPLASEGAQGQETLGLLQQRLHSAEEDTKDLVNQLTQLGIHGKKQGELLQHDITPISPYKMRSCQDSDALVSRVCKLESAIQTMRLSLVRAQAERDLSKEEKMAANEKLTSTSDAYEKELAKANRELVQCRKDLKDAVEERRSAQEKVSNLQESLDNAHAEKSEALVQVEDLKSTKAKYSRRVTALREELSRESSLRASLEESHNTLLKRIQEVEATVEHEQLEVKNMNTICSQLKRENIRAKEEAELERSLRLNAEESLKKITAQSGNVQAQKSTLQEDKAYLMAEMNKMRTRYNELIQQLDQTHKLVSDKQSTHEQLEKENKRLFEAMKSAANQNAQLIAKYEEEIESMKTEVATKLQLDEKVKHLSEQLRVESREKGHAVTTNSQLSAKSQDLEDKVSRHEQDMEEMRAHHKKELSELREKLRNKELEKEQIMKDKDNLLDEVNQAVDQMVDERSNLQCQLQQTKIDLESSIQTESQLKQENKHLLERVGAMEEQAKAANQIEATMSEMMEQKNKLAYDKGRLQNQVAELHRQVEQLAEEQNELVRLRKVTASTESQYKRSQTELNNCRMLIQRLESQLKQQGATVERKEDDFRLAIQARDEALKEAQKLLSHIEDMEDRQKYKVGGLERSLGDSRQDSKKVAATLESVIQSHTQLQHTVEGLQIELGKRDAQITRLSEERSTLHQRNKQLQNELENIQSKLVSIKSLEETEVEPLRRAIELCKSDNSKMASSLETVVKSNGTLQLSIEGLNDELEKKIVVIEQLQEVRDREKEAHQQQVETYQKRLENIVEHLNRERGKTLKKTNKEFSEMRKQIEELVAKNGELSRANSDLRHKVTAHEYEAKDNKEKMAALRSQIDHHTKMRQKQEDSLKNVQVLGSQLEALENSNKEYVKENNHQAKMIRRFMSQMSNLQEELQGLAQSQTETALILQQQEEQLRCERSRNDELKRKYKESRRREGELEELRRQTEDKLHEANNESLLISSNLTDAHTWFKSKFDSLQDELKKSRTNQAGLIHDKFEQKHLYEEEKRKAQETTEKAREMIKSSRETIGRLADYAEVAQKETTTQMRDLYKQLESEKDKTRQTKAKYMGFKASSMRHTEELARELDVLRSHTFLPYDSINSSGS